MPFMPYMDAQKSKADAQTKFGGYVNHKAADGSQFVDMLNMSSDEYPILTPRKKRRLIREIKSGTGLLGGDKLAWVDGTGVYLDGKRVLTVSAGEKQLIRMGAYLIVWPDRKIYNTHTGETLAMDYTYTHKNLTVRPCTLTGAIYHYTSGSEPPASPAQYDYWYNTETGGFYQYLGGQWEGIDTVYARISGIGVGAGFADYDAVTISGMPEDAYNIEGATIYARADDYIVIITGEIKSFTATDTVTIKREAPELDFICESGNRLWGCSNQTHEIRATKLGDPTNWNCYLGISTDSYAATVGSGGDFTGIYTYMGYVHFFKENCAHRLYGTRPENFQLTEIPLRGVKQGCHKSLTTVNEILYYVSRDGVMAYDGSSPVRVGEALGDVTLTDAVAGSHGRKLYLSALAAEKGGKAATPSPMLYVLDTGQGLWHVEDDLRALSFASTPEGDFILDDKGRLWTIDGERSALEDGAKDEDEITWRATTGDIGLDKPYQKWIKRITARIEMERGARLSVDIQYDSDGRWQRVMEIETERKKNVLLPLRTQRCDHLALRFSGRGRVRIYGIGKTYDEGSERQCLTYRA